LEGRADLTRGAARPRLAIELSAPEIQLEDFELADWRATGTAPETGDDTTIDADPGVTREEIGVAGLLSERTLERLDARLSVRVGQVRSGRDEWGAGELLAELEAGRLSIDPVRVEGAGGAITLGAVFQPSGDELSSELRLLSERFDYGVLARLLQPDADLAGLFGIDLDIHGRAPLAAPLFSQASGHLDIAVFPTNLSSELIDLWTVNLLRALLPVLDPREGSEIGCVLGFFDLESGVMRERELLLDTTNMSVRGKVEIDFGERTLDALLRPSAKKPAFLSLATPIRVHGGFDEFDLDLTPGSLLATSVRMVTSPIHVPLRRLAGLFKGTVVEDDCLQGLSRAERLRAP
jgi:hypothetical protein